jgi:holliday junction DNA helicase RuvB
MNESTAFDEAVRPTTWDDYVGQKRMKSRLDISIEAAITQERRLDDILLIWPPGTGKTTIAALIADRFHSDFRSVTLPLKPDRLFDIVEEMEEGVLFLDELHAASKTFQELLQPALEEDRVLLTADGYEIDVSGIVFVAATVPEFAPKILEPLQQRFQIRPDFEPYSHEDITTILDAMARRLGFELSPEACEGLANACGATPRLAKRFVKAARDLAAVGMEVSAAAVLDHVGVDADGLSNDHLMYLETIKSQKGKAGLRTLANLMCMSPNSVENLERTLARQGLVHLSQQGRRLTPAGRAKIGSSKGSFTNA